MSTVDCMESILVVASITFVVTVTICFAQYQTRKCLNNQSRMYRNNYEMPEQVASRGPRFATADSLKGTPRSLVLVNRAGSYATSFRGRRPLSVGCKEGSLGVATERSV